MLVDGSPQVDALAIHPQEHLIQVPRLPAVRLPTPKLLREARPERVGPAANRFVGDLDPMLSQPFFPIAVAERKAIVQPAASERTSAGTRCRWKWPGRAGIGAWAGEWRSR